MTGVPEMIEDSMFSKKTGIPSVVALHPDGKTIYVGQAAVNCIGGDEIPAQNIITNFKRLIGKR